MNTWLGRALIAAGTAGMVYGVYLLAGTGWAVVLGAFVVYVAGYHLTLRKRADGNPAVKVTAGGVRYVTASDVLSSESGGSIVNNTRQHRKGMN